jgi:hypothetical protein
MPVSVCNVHTTGVVSKSSNKFSSDGKNVENCNVAEHYCDLAWSKEDPHMVLTMNDSSLYKSMGIVGMGIKSTSLEPYRLILINPS